MMFDNGFSSPKSMNSGSDAAKHLTVDQNFVNKAMPEVIGKTFDNRTGLGNDKTC